LDTDLGETKDLRSVEPAVYLNLKTQLLNWEKSKMKPLWTEGAIWDTITLMIHDDLMNNRKVRVSDPQQLEKFLKAKSN
jgi:hypothetical protein